MWEFLFSTALILFFVLLNGFFVAAEFAIVKVRSTQIEPLVARGDWRARVAKDVITHLDAYLSATQLGITMASLALGWLGEPLVADQLRPLLEEIGIGSPEVVAGISFGIGFAIITFLHIILGELAPKSLAIQKPSGTTLWTAYPLRLFFTIFKPIIWTLNSLANAILSVIGIQPAGESELMHSEEELRLLLAQERGVSVTSRQMVLNAMDFRRKQARHCMVPRMEMLTLSVSAPVQDNLAIMRSNKYSRYPVYRDSIENVIGIVYTKDIFKHERQLKPEFSLESFLRDATFLPETISLERVLETMLQRKTHMVILADEYGGTAGLITLEDVLEELVGPIQDEFDRELPEITRLSDDEYILDASVTTNEVERLIDRELSPKDILSIGGFLLEQLGHIPEKSERVQVNGVEFTVEQVADRTIERVRVKRLPIPERGDEVEHS